MDNLSHSLFGAHVSRLPAFRGVAPRLAFWTAVAASNAPDVDGLLRFAGAQHYVFDHRGITHSLVAVLVLAPAVALIARAAGRGSSPAFAPLLVLSIAGVLGHLLLDLLTSWGTMLLLPFSSARLALPWLFILDVVVWLILGVPLLRTAWQRRRGGIPDAIVRRRSAAALSVFSLYVGVCGLAHNRVREAALSALPDGEKPEAVLAYPAPPGPLIWTTLVRTSDQAWHRGFASALTGGVTTAGVVPTGLDDPRVQVALETELGQAYRHFATALYRVNATPLSDDGSYEVTLGDLRFSGPFWDDVPFQLWMQIGNDFRVRDWAFQRGTLSPDAPAEEQLPTAAGELP